MSVNCKTAIIYTVNTTGLANETASFGEDTGVFRPETGVGGNASADRDDNPPFHPSDPPYILGWSGKGGFSMLDDEGGFPAVHASSLNTSNSAAGSVAHMLPVYALVRLAQDGPTGALDGMERVLRHLRAHFREEVPMQVLADLVRLSLRQFHRNFKKKFGMPPNQYLIRMRVQAAGDLLISDTRPIAEIAYMLGFADDTLFIRQFKSRMGMTPLQYRKTMR